VNSVSRFRPTADVLDEHEEAAITCEVQFRDFGGELEFAGPIETVCCVDDNVLLRACLTEPGKGRVLVVDGSGSYRRALVGDNVARRAAEAGWAGLVINGCVRDSNALSGLPIGIKALGTSPRRPKKFGTGERNITVVFGGALFEPGSFLYGDSDGIAVVALPA
jgi:regulator of ribonuclease activity A